MILYGISNCMPKNVKSSVKLYNMVISKFKVLMTQLSVKSGLMRIYERKVLTA